VPVSGCVTGRAVAAAAACLAATCLAGAAAPAQAGKTAKPKVVSVADFYFGPSAVTIHKGGTVKWVWAPTNVESHDVHLKKGPKGLKQRGSYSTKTTAVANATFKHAFPTPGTYNFICTIHPTKMKLTVTVKE
jgi:plastocyanin